ncbi:uncharacterized protein LOC125194547 [Salvia hispanica]|uniref:uncharacterized protein LOC125194547 n=1 Tax=Salvia hispanica TaxID=49212 RepID=UPI002009884F|nr:uncharacterized protein LOC125194547 [Salvia hispanica]
MDFTDIIVEAEREEQEYDEQYRAAYEAYVAANTPAPPPRPTKSTRRYIPRDREGANGRLVANYFFDQPRFPEYYFWRRFRMLKRLFMRIVNTLSARGEYFQSRRDAVGRQSLSVLQKCTCAIRQLATAQTVDLFDEYLHVGESTGILCLKNFCDDIRSAFGDEFLRAPTTEDCQRLLHLHETVHRFPADEGPRAANFNDEDDAGSSTARSPPR